MDRGRQRGGGGASTLSPRTASEPTSGPPRWVDDAAGLRAVVDRLRDAPRYALDTEFHRERTYYPQLALLQLVADDGDVVLVDPLAVDVEPLAEVLAGPATAVMHAADQDLEVLARACGVVPSCLFDTQIAAGFIGMTAPPLGALTAQLLGIRLPKASRLTDWLQRPLGREQITYAASDVAHLMAIHDHLLGQLEEAGRLGWAADECERLRRRSRDDPDPERAWLRIKEARTLSGKARGVARALAAWRERTAAERDDPVRFVLPDLGLVAIAQAAPRSRDDLTRIRGIDGRHLRDSRSILEAVQRGLDEPQPPRAVSERTGVDPQLRPAVALAAAWLAQLARDLRLDPATLASRADIEIFVAGEPGARLSEGWRADLVGEPLRRLLAGAAAVAFDGAGRLVLEARSGQPLPLGDGR